MNQPSEELKSSRNNRDGMSPKVYQSTASKNSKKLHMRHSSINSYLSNSPGSFKVSSGHKSNNKYKNSYKYSEFDSCRDLKKSTSIEKPKYGGINRVRKYYERATKLSPRSWVKKNSDTGATMKKSSSKTKGSMIKNSINTTREKKKGLENIASRLSLLSSAKRLRKSK